MIRVLNVFYIAEYSFSVDDSAMPCDSITSSSECQSAARELGLSDVWAVDDGQTGEMYDPPFCYFEESSLKFNNLGTNTGLCDTYDICLCRQNDFCAITPCGEGQGDCDDDNECEGSLVCGQLNCVMNNTILDCCTSTCHDDSDCNNQECNVDINQCRLDSYSTAWSNCSQASPCAHGEGDCDHDNDCEGASTCGNDNCGSGPIGLDCCIDDTGRNNKEARRTWHYSYCESL